MWHSYENKQDRPIRIMAKNLHYSTDTEAIKEDLKIKGLKIIDVKNKLSWRENKRPLDVYFVI